MISAQNGQTISVLKRVGFADGSVYSFDYNSYVQVHTIRRYTPNSLNPGSFPDDYTQLSYVSYDLPRDAFGEQNDCPRYRERTDWAKDWNNNTTVNTTFDGDLNSWGTVTSPDGVTYKEFYGTSGWQRGLTLQSETWYNGAKKKWTDTIWKNDNDSLPYQLNPKVIETNVYDESNNRKRTKIEYTEYNSISDIYEYLNATDVYRHSKIEYLRGSTYIDNKNRRMTGFVKSQSVYDGSGNIQSKVSYEYDQGGEYLISQGPPIRHDSTKYGVSFNQGRGNVNIVRKWDITDSNNQEKSLVSYVGYNTSGSVIFAKDGLGHQTQIKYDDFFSDSINRNTLAFPTKLIDPDSYESSIQYNYDLGLTTKSRNPKGAEIENTFDLIGRLERTTNKVNGAYTRYVYSLNQTSIQSFTTIKDLDLASEYFQITLLDGHGRTRAAASTHPTSIGGMKAQLFVFDQIGRQIRQTNPTEIDTSWNSTGDDVAGFLWTSQAYDWKGRPVESINVDGTKRLISYETCGCTGVNTISYTDEVGRTRKEYYDVFGRLSESRALNSDGSIYTTTSNIYNLLDQNLRVFIQEGEAGIGRETLMTYDGFGRLATRKHPIEAAPSSFTYNADDTVNTVTDARGVVTTYGYNSRKLVTSINYGAVNGVIQLKPVTFGYDEVGNRLWMDDEPGRVDYHYNSISQMEWEERRFDDLSGIYRLNYQYNVGGQLTEITDFLNDTIYYNYNKAGEVLSITGKDQVSGSQYYYTSLANNATVKYTAWGGIKQFTHGNNIKTSFEYNERMLPKKFEITEHTNPPSYYDQGMRNTYSYYADGNIKFSKDEIHNDYDKSYEYDHLGRVSKASAGEVARGGTHSPYPPYDTPYSHSFIYNVWGNKETVNAFYWNYSDNESSQFDNVTGRKSLWVYDDAGHLMQDDDQKYLYDSSGNNQEIRKRWTNTLIKKGVQDGDGASVIYSSVNDDNVVKLSYYLTSTALGGKLLLKLDGQGQKTEEFIYLGNNRIATLFVVQAHGKVVSWEHQNPVSGDLGISFSDGKYRTESTLDPMGVDLMSAYPFVEPPTGESDPNYLSYFPEYKGRNGQPLKCYLDGINLPCYSIMESSGESQIAAPSSTTLGVYKKKTGAFLGYARWDGNPADPNGYFAYKLGFTFDFIPKGNKSEGVLVEGNYILTDRYQPTRPEYINVVSGDLIGGGFRQSKTSVGKTNKPSVESKCGRAGEPSWGDLVKGYNNVLNPLGYKYIENGKQNWEVVPINRPSYEARPSHNEVASIAKQHGWSSYLNVNPPHWGGDNYEKYYDGMWLHLTIGYGMRVTFPSNKYVEDNNAPPAFVTIHCETLFQPSSKEHADDWWKKNVFIPVARFLLTPFK